MTKTQTRLPRFAAGDDVADMASALDEHGCAVITGVVAPESLTTIRAELDPYLKQAPIQQDNPEDFYPGLTRRVTALASRSTSVRELIMHPLSLDLTEHHLGSNCERFQLHATAALEIGPGARTQILHREEDPFSFFPQPRPNLVLATMWAVSDFESTNGATLLVPGSHRWSADRQPEDDDIAIAEMPAGSVLFWVGGLLHGAGANTSQNWRYGIILSYSCGWLRQEENQYLDVTAAGLETMDSELKKVLGFTMHGALGFHDPSLLEPR